MREEKHINKIPSKIPGQSNEILVLHLFLSFVFFRKKNEPKPKVLGPDVCRWGGGLPREGVGAKKFGMSLETREVKLFWRDIPDFAVPAVPEKLERKKLVFNYWPLLFSLLNFEMLEVKM